MKTKNNVQKTILRWAAVVVSFVLVSYTVSAQEFLIRLLENSSFNDIAIAMVDVPDEADLLCAEDPNAETLYMEGELESWMTDCTEFEFDIQGDLRLDDPLPEADWKMNEARVMLETEEEASLGLEDWMISEEVWGI